MKMLKLVVLALASADGLRRCFRAPSACVIGRPCSARRPSFSSLSGAVQTSETAEAVAATDSAIALQYPPVPPFTECLTFAINAVGIYAAPTLMSLIDAAFLGRVSTTELAALGPAGSISDSVPFFLLFVSIAATNLVAKAHATDNTAASARITRTSLLFGGLGGLLLAIPTFLGASALSRFYCGATAVTLAPLCARYVGIRALALPAVVVASVAQAILIGMKDTRTPMLAVAVAACLNFGGDLLLVSGMKLGIAGAAWATVASQLCAAALLLRVLARRRLLTPPAQMATPTQSSLLAVGAGASESSSNASPADTWATIVAICSFASFVFVMTVKVSMHNACSAAAASLGGTPAAAHTALMAVAWLCFTFGDVGSSLAQAYLPAFASAAPPAATASEVSPTSRAASEDVVRSPSFDLAAARPTIAMLLRVTWSISGTVVLLSSLIIGVFAGQLTPDVAVQAQMRRVLPLMVATLAAHGTAVTLEGLLLARKAFRALTLAYTGVLVSVAAGLYFVRSSGAGLLGVWAMYVWYCAGRALMFAGLGGLFGRG